MSALTYNPLELAPFFEQLSLDGPDEGPFLVFADWLLSRGDPWGELIVMSCQGGSDELALYERRVLKISARWRNKLVRGFIASTRYDAGPGDASYDAEIASLFTRPIARFMTDVQFDDLQDRHIPCLVTHASALVKLRVHFNRFDGNAAEERAVKKAFPAASFHRREREGIVPGSTVLDD